MWIKCLAQWHNCCCAPHDFFLLGVLQHPWLPGAWTVFPIRNSILYKLLFSRGFYFREFPRARPSRKFPLQFMSIYSNDNIRKIAKLTTRELPQKSKKKKITVRENNGLYSNMLQVGISGITYLSPFFFFFMWKGHTLEVHCTNIHLKIFIK